MLKLRVGDVPKRGSISGRWAAIAMPVLLAGGCANQAQTQTPNWYAQGYAGGPAQEAVAAVPVPVRVETEEDGRPAQLPPVVRAKAEPDDPSEPYSPNYGGPAQAQPVTAARPDERRVSDASRAADRPRLASAADE